MGGGPQGLASVPVEEKFEDGGEGEDWNLCAHPLLLPGSPLPSLPSADTNSNSSGTWHRLLCHTILQPYLQLPPMQGMEQGGVRLHRCGCNLSWWIHNGC